MARKMGAESGSGGNSQRRTGAGIPGPGANSGAGQSKKNRDIGQKKSATKPQGKRAA
jgi:hypothetical protein